MKRQSNFELLRIIAMIMIIGHHLAVHSAIPIDINHLTINTFFTYIMRIGGKIGVNIFVLISGYFLINKDKLSISKVLKLWLQVFTYSISIFIVFAIFKKTNFNIKNIKEALLPISFKYWWFASTYFILYLFSPYINIFLKSLDKVRYKKLLILTTICWCIIPSVLRVQLESNYLVWFIYLYSLAAYIKLYKDDIKTRASKWFKICSITSLLTVLFSLIITYLSVKYKSLSVYKYHFYGMQTFPILLISISIFLGFKNIDIKYNKFINLISISTFGIYLIHDNKLIRGKIWSSIFKIAQFYSKKIYIPYCILVIVIIFVVCSIIELIRIYMLEKYYMKLVNILSNKLEILKDKFYNLKILEKL